MAFVMDALWCSVSECFRLLPMGEGLASLLQVEYIAINDRSFRVLKQVIKGISFRAGLTAKQVHAHAFNVMQCICMASQYLHTESPSIRAVPYCANCRHDAVCLSAGLLLCTCLA